MFLHSISVCWAGYPLGGADDAIKFENDMLLTPAQRDFLAAQRSNRHRRAAIKNEKFLWPGGKVYYAFADYMGMNTANGCYQELLC